MVSAIFDLEPTTADSDYELAFRSVGGGKRSLVIVFTDLLEEAAARSLVEAVPVLARRHHVVVASVRDPDLDRAVRTPPAEVRDVLAASVVVEALDARARVAAQLAGPAPRCWRRRPTPWPPPASAPTCGPRPAAGSRPPGPEVGGRPTARGRPRQKTRAQYGAATSIPTAMAPASGRLVGVTNPSTSPASTNHGIVPSTISAPRRAPRPEGGPPAAPAGVDERPADGEPRRTADGDHRQLQHPVGRDQGQERAGPPGGHRQPGHPADQGAVVEQHEGGADPGQDPAGEGHERHLDVVGQDLAGQRGLAADGQAEVAPAVVPDAPELGGQERAAAAGSEAAQAPSRTAGDEHEEPAQPDQTDPLPDEPPVAPGQEVAQRGAAALGGVDEVAGPADKVLQPDGHRVAGPAPAGQGEVGRRRPVGRPQPAHAARARAARDGARRWLTSPASSSHSGVRWRTKASRFMCRGG